MNLVQVYDKVFGNIKQARNLKIASIPEAMLPDRTVTEKEFIDLLNEDLVLEYTAALQYIQHYSTVQGAAYDHIREHLKVHSEEEMNHAVLLSDRINFLGGVPLANIGKVETSHDSVQMLNQDLNSEREAITRYKERIIQAISLGDFGTVKILQDILEDEEEHASDLETSLGKDKKDKMEVVLENTSEELPSSEGYDRDKRKQEILDKLEQMVRSRG